MRWVNFLSFHYSLKDLIISRFRIHVRRSDKLQIEAFSYSFESYMEQANEFYDLLDLIEPFKNFKRVVYLTTDDIGVFNETLKFLFEILIF